MEVKLKDGRTLVISEAQPDEAEALLAHINIIGGESDNMTFGANECPYTVEEERAFLAQFAASKTSAMFVGHIDGAIVATASLSGDGRRRMRHIGGLGIAVRKLYWGLGIGEAMMNALFDYARGAGLTVLHLVVRAANAPAIHMYEKLGFERVGVHRGYFHIGDAFDDAIIMEKHL